MRHVVIVLASVGMIWAGSPPVDGSDMSVLARTIESAAGALLSEEQPSRGEVQSALADLLGAAAGISATAELPAPAQERLEAAVATYQEGGFLEPDAVATVHRAYETVTGGQAFAFPEGVGSIAEATDYGRLQLQRALGALEAGRSREAVREVLGFVLLVTTPQKRH